MVFLLMQQYIIEIPAHIALSSKDILFIAYYNNALTINIIFRIMKNKSSIILKMER